MDDMLKGLYPGSFDPPTLGHLEIIERASPLFEVLVVGIGENLTKGETILTVNERIEALQKETSSLKNVEIAAFSGLSTEFAKAVGANVLIRGLRSYSDMENEMQMANANRKISGIETLFLMAGVGTVPISSSLIRELALNGAPLQDFIPKGVENILQLRLQERK